MKRHISLVYMAAILLSFHYFLITYINSSFLRTFFSQKTVGVLYLLGSVLTIIIFLSINPLLRKIGNTKLAVLICVLQLIALVSLAFTKIPIIIAVAFIVQHTIYPLLLLNLDIFLEHWSERTRIGTLRGLFLMTINTCAPLAALISGTLVNDGNYTLPYLISSVFILCLIILIVVFFKNYDDCIYEAVPKNILVRILSHNENVRSIFIVNFLLNFTYAWLIIYIPLYLTTDVGMSWQYASSAIAISLISFVIFQIPLGKIADAFNAERSILLIGFLLMIGAFATIPFIHSTTLAVWATILFIARAGASFVEVGNESYFFKLITDANSEVMEFWRMNSPLATIFGSGAGIIASFFLPFGPMFFVLSFVLIIGVYVSFNLKTVSA